MNSFKTYTIPIEDRERLIFIVKSELLKHKEIVFAYVYGSFVDHEMPFFRDIDIGVFVDESAVPVNKFMDYSINLSLKLESLMKKYPVDVVILNNAPLNLVFKITQGELLFIRDEDLWTDFVTKAWSLYNDHAITSRHILEEIITA
ncbi:nucleotidyltransferase domain-containing protein [Dissulfurispira sp.]|uniref:nucleotidyltransferase domain-containing protein n=1 Tax=Dissulfurispira sp. TaxID=2817609 RepID=UPI002FDA5FC7